MQLCRTHAACWILFAAIALGTVGCDSRAEKHYDQGGKFKDLADNTENSDQRHENYNKAIEQYTIATELEPGEEKYYRKLGQCYKNIERWDKAEEVLRRAIEVDPDEADNYDLLMGVFINSGQFDKAEKLYQAAVNMDIFKRNAREKMKLDTRYQQMLDAKAQMEEQQTQDQQTEEQQS